jgi:hypothetical protein
MPKKLLMVQKSKMDDYIKQYKKDVNREWSQMDKEHKKEKKREEKEQGMMFDEDKPKHQDMDMESFDWYKKKFKEKYNFDLKPSFIDKLRRFLNISEKDQNKSYYNDKVFGLTYDFLRNRDPLYNIQFKYKYGEDLFKFMKDNVGERLIVDYLDEKVRDEIFKQIRNIMGEKGFDDSDIKQAIRDIYDTDLTDFEKIPFKDIQSKVFKLLKDKKIITSYEDSDQEESNEDRVKRILLEFLRKNLNEDQANKAFKEILSETPATVKDLVDRVGHQKLNDKDIYKLMFTVFRYGKVLSRYF